MTLLLRGGKLLDGTGAPARIADIAVSDGRIAAVGTDLPAAAGAEVVELAGRSVMPGIVDCHVHITMGETLLHPRSWMGKANFMTEREAGFMHVSALAARQMAVAQYTCRRLLEAGVTTVRDVGVSAGQSDVVIREAVQSGFMPGPRILACGGGIAMTGGHGWDLGVAEADGADEVRKLVRLQLKAGADVIKIFATKAGLYRDIPGGPEFSVEEMRVICDEAHQQGKRVAAHAVGAEGIKRTILAGVDTVEHGCYLDEEGAEMMAERGTWLISTLHPYDRQAELCTTVGYPPYAAERSQEIMAVYPRNIAMALERGVKVALGSDCGIPSLTPHGENAREIVLFHKLVGRSAVEAVARGTGEAARALGIEREVGTLEPGKAADLMVVEADLEAELDALLDSRRIARVLLGGRTVASGGVLQLAAYEASTATM